jgi:Transglycosylase SLT domain
MKQRNYPRTTKLYRDSLALLLCNAAFFYGLTADAKSYDGREYDVSISQSATIENEAPAVQSLLIEANKLLADEKMPDESYWKAADKFCQASRYGSAEGMYRLGLLYMLGMGVPENIEYASSLYGVAAMHGHFESQKMLETMPVRSENLPVCLMSEVAPERSFAQGFASDRSPAIETYVASLPKDKKWLVNLAEKIAKWHQVDSRLVLSIISAESAFKNSALSPKNASGVMQLIPATAQRFNVKNVFNASQNIKGGVKYLRWLLSYFRGDVTLAVAAYNAGEHTVDRYKGVPPFKETKNYVKKVMSLYERKQHAFDANLSDPSPILKSR